MRKKLTSLLCVGFGMMALLATTALAADVFDVRIANGNDDVEEYVSGHNMYTGSTDLEIPYEENINAGSEQVVGLRWAVPVPKGAMITKAYVEFTYDEPEVTGEVHLIIEGQLAANAPAFTSSASDVTNRTRTKAQVKWAPEAWTSGKYKTADVSAVIQEIVNQPAWVAGNALVLIIRDDKSNPSKATRVAAAYEDDPAAAALLHIEISRGPATSPSPVDAATDVPIDTVLSWMAGQYAATHDVYLGTTLADVQAATRMDAKGLLASQGQTGTTFDPPGVLAYGQTYYWRIDEVNKSPDNTIIKSGVWSFTTEPYAYPVKPVKATASSSQANMGPEKTIDNSGMTGDLAGIDPPTMWLSAGVAPNWIQYEFDKVYKLHQLLVWNSNQMIEAFMGFGAKTVKIETSTDGTTWTELANVPEFARAPGTAGYAANTTVTFGGVEAKFVKLTITASWGGIAPQMGLSEVRFLCIPVQARLPQPASGAKGVSSEATLTWRPGRGATSHKVYFGADQAAVTGGTAAAKTVTDCSFSPGALDLGATYYWRVDEVNAATYPGDVWSFTAETYKVVDDFESYTDQAGNEVFSIWIDGYADNYKSSGSTVGLDTSVNGTFCESTIIHGGKQSMPLRYDNTKAPVSEAVRTFDKPQDWTASGIKSLSLWFQGVAGNSGQLYVKINSIKIAYDGDAADLGRGGWHVWNIDLSKAGKVNSVRTLTVGVEGNGATGTLYIDDIRLYPKTPEYITPVQPAATGLIAYYTFDEGSGSTAKDSSGKGNNGTIAGSTTWVAGTKGGALQLGGSGYVIIDGVAKSMPANNNFTVNAWIKTKGTSGYVVASNDDSGGHVFTIGPGSGGALQVVANSSHTYPPVINDDQWHMITYVRNGTTASIYTDGALVGTETPTANPAAQTKWSIGMEWDPPSASDFYTGAVDDVRFYARPLSAEEVAGLFGLTKPFAKPF